MKYVCVICCLLMSFQFGLSLSNFHRYIWPCFVTLNCGSLADCVGWQTGGSLPACRFLSGSGSHDLQLPVTGKPSDDLEN